MRYFARVCAASVAVMLLLGGCTASKPPPYQGIGYAGELVPGKEVTVGRGENVYTIARNHGVRMREIIALNNLQPPFLLKPGQRLVLPAQTGGSASPGSVGEPVPSAAPLQAIDRTPLSAGRPAPSTGGVTAVPLEAPPGAKTSTGGLTSSNLSSGQRTTAPSDVKASAMPFGPPSGELPPDLTAGTGPKVADATPTTVMPSAEAASEKAETHASGGTPSFIWPLQGPVLSAYGAKGQTGSNDGLNIGAPKGAPVVAAAGGTVAYAGDDMKGFGNLVLVRHEGGWVTAYAHLDRVIVAKDSIVAAGDMIGTVGASGGVASPQLHFEIRQDGKPVDPQSMLKK